MLKEVITSFTMPSGIRCVHKRVKSPALYCGMTINAGTRDEKVAEHGVAHLIEHLLFKGTKRRKPYHINSFLDNRGGEVNAFTTKEETVVHAVTLKEDFHRGVDLVCDIIFNSTFPENELKKEKNIIYDEINSYKDSPSELIFDDFEDALFSGSSLGRNILGTQRSLSGMGVDNLKSFRQRCYNTDQMAFAVVGDISIKRFEYICQKYLSDIKPNNRSLEREMVAEVARFDTAISKRTHQSHCIIGARAYPHKDDRRVALALLVNVLGGMSANSRLNIALREKSALAYGVEAGYTSYSDTGVATIYFGTDKESVDQACQLVNKELSRVRTESFSTLELARVKRQLLGQMLIAAEANENSMLSMGKSMLIYGEVDSVESVYKKVNSITSSQIMDVANEIFAENNISSLLYK